MADRDSLFVPGQSREHIHVFSVFGPFCYLCLRRKRWWKLWEKWTVEEHDEPF